MKYFTQKRVCDMLTYINGDLDGCPTLRIFVSLLELTR